VRVDSDKFTRALAWANLAEEGKVYLVKGGWNQDFLEEVCRFTGKGDKHDDQVDAVSLAVRMLSARRGKLETF
jgi:predicted phage terminase large subunit-like protein